MVEFEFHMSAVPGTTLPHRKAGTDGAEARILSANAGSRDTTHGPPTA